MKTSKVKIQSGVDVVKARMCVRNVARAAGMHLGDQARISLAASSLAQAMGLGAECHGQLEAKCISDQGRTGVKVTCLRPGNSYSLDPATLDDTRWMVDQLLIDERASRGIEVILIKWPT